MSELQFPDLAQRIVVGPVLVIAGAAILGSVALFRMFVQPADWYQALGMILGAVAYSAIGALFVLLGVQFIVGERAWISRWLKSSLWHLAATVVVMACVSVGAICIVLW